MADKEISIAEYGINDCKGNLRELRSLWGNAPTISASKIEESAGQSAERIKETTEVVKMVRDAFDNLLDSTIRFFEQAGISFEEADSAAEDNINKITGTK